ncbi:MAG: 50S ribosomal protein L6 [Candidatus Omnitrophica bacterium]|nr:50S ribosomal protein L6 [Candidatus Omnitrophota bacterium]
MSRVGRKPVLIPSGVKVQLEGRHLNVQGPKGKMDLSVHPRMNVQLTDKQVEVTRPSDIRTDRSLHGLTRNLIQNMVLGVTQGYTKELDIEGVGFKAAVKGNQLTLSLGFTHPVEFKIPEGIQIKCTTPTHIVVTGVDKQLVGEVAAEIRRFHEPEPYKGKGVRYTGEVIRRKQGKTVG